MYAWSVPIVFVEATIGMIHLFLRISVHKILAFVKGRLFACSTWLEGLTSEFAFAAFSIHI